MATALQQVEAVLRGIRDFSVMDNDLFRYLAGMVTDCETLSLTELSNKLSPFALACNIEKPDVDAAIPVLYAKLKDSGLIRPPPEKHFATGDVNVKSMLREAGLLEEKETAEDRKAAETAGLRLLNAPLTLGSRTLDSSTLDMLWGKENNAFLNQNKEMDESYDARAAKRAARDAKKEDARLRAEEERAAAALAAEEAVRKASGAVTSGTVTYRITQERKQQDIAITGFNMGYGGELLLENAELKINMGRRYGLVGRNGMGKSTLLRHMARGDIAGSGSQRFPLNLRVLHVEQEVTGSGETVLQTVLAADVERDFLLREEAKLIALVEQHASGGGDDRAGVATTTATASTAAASDVESGVTTAAAREPIDIAAAHARLAQISARLENIDAASAEARAGSILSGLGFTTDMLAWSTKSLSGGWRMRVALACALFCEPDVLCLDEPTNHIDAKSVTWLVDYLTSYPHTLVIVSHDRWFLNAVCTDIIHLFDKKLTYYKGDYDTFERTRAEKQRHLEKATETQEAKRKHIQSFIDKFRYNAKRASLVQSRIKALERMDVLEEVADDPKWKFEFPDPGPLGIPVLQIDDVTFGYKAGKPLFRGVNFAIDTTSRIAIVGPNGVGKSTLLKLILGELEAQEGAVQRNPKLRMACFTQHHINQLDLEMTPLEFLLSIFPGSKPDAVRAHLGSFGISGDLALQRMGTMSGGQKSRVAFSILTWKKPHVLVLDEPSNNLDIETIDAVIVALANYNGGVILVSHDQHFVESVCDEIYVVGTPPGRVSKFKGEFKDYRKVAEAEKAFKVDSEA